MAESLIIRINELIEKMNMEPIGGKQGLGQYSQVRRSEEERVK